MTAPSNSEHAPLQLLLVEDEAHFAEWVIQALKNNDPRWCIDWARNLGEAKELIAATHANLWRLAIVDLRLGQESGIDLISHLNERLPNVPILVVTAVDMPETALNAIRVGAQGYLLKEGEENSLLWAIEQVLAGSSPITPSIARQLLNEFRAMETPQHNTLAQPFLELLSARESEVLNLVAYGYSNKEVAHELGISSHTVNIHIRKIYSKLNVNSRASLRRVLKQ